MANEELTAWDLKVIFGYQRIDDPKLINELKHLEDVAGKFHNAYNGKLAVDGMLALALGELNDISERLAAAGMYAGNLKAISYDNPETLKKISLLETTISNIEAHWNFFNVQLGRLDLKLVEDALQKSEKLREFEPYIRHILQFKEHTLSEEVEKILCLRSPHEGRKLASNYFNEELTLLKFQFMNPVTNKLERDLTLEQICNHHLRNIDWRVRHASMKGLNDGLKETGFDRKAAFALNIIANDAHIMNKLRNYTSPRQSRNLGNCLSDEIVDNLISVIRNEGAVLTKRYYSLLKAILKAKTDLKIFTWADRNAPVCAILDGDTQTIYSWSDCQKLVKECFNSFSPRFAELFQTFVDEKRIDVAKYPGKKSGGFCSLGTKQTGPLEFINYEDNMESVLTVAHESGHAIHGYLTYKQHFLQQDPSSTLAETASIFGEMIVFHKLINDAQSPESKLGWLMEKIGHVMNSVPRQISFDQFEEKVYSSVASGAISSDDTRRSWLEITREFYGKEGEVFESYEDIDCLWSYVMHFIDYPFYVYSYAFADLVVGSLYNVYRTKKFPDFEERFIDLLESGSTRTFQEAMEVRPDHHIKCVPMLIRLFQQFGLDGTSKQFWIDALSAYVGTLMDEAEKIAIELNLIGDH